MVRQRKSEANEVSAASYYRYDTSKQKLIVYSKDGLDYELSSFPICFICSTKYQNILEKNYSHCCLYLRKYNNYYAFCSCNSWLISGTEIKHGFNPVPQLDFYFDVTQTEQDNAPEYFLKNYGYI